MKQPEIITTEQITTAAHEAYEKLPREHIAREGFGQITFTEGFAEGVKWKESLVGKCKLIEITDGFINYSITDCCKIGPIVNENYCPECGKMIMRNGC